jgi:hypothetical protein
MSTLTPERLATLPTVDELDWLRSYLLAQSKEVGIISKRRHRAAKADEAERLWQHSERLHLLATRITALRDWLLLEV